MENARYFHQRIAAFSRPFDIVNCRAGNGTLGLRPWPGGAPIVALALRGVLHGDVTVDLMGSVAMIASIIVGEYTAAALVVFMLSLGEALEDFTVSRANNSLKDLAELVPVSVTVIRDTSKGKSGNLRNGKHHRRF